MVKFVQATSEDILSIDPQLPQCDATVLNYGREVFASGLVPLENRAMAIHDEERCIGVYGLIEMWPGVARIWALFSEAVLTDHPHVLALHAQRDLKRVDKFGFHRLEATRDPKHENAMKFLEWLGFIQEGLMRRYGPSGEDSYLYARVRNGL